MEYISDFIEGFQSVKLSPLLLIFAGVFYGAGEFFWRCITFLFREDKQKEYNRAFIAFVVFVPSITALLFYDLQFIAGRLIVIGIPSAIMLALLIVMYRKADE